MADFDLLGNPDDETRILRERQSGYSVPLVGRASLAPAPDGPPRYDVVVKLADVPVEHGFRLDEVPGASEPKALAEALALAYGRSRAREGTSVIAMGVGETLRPTAAKGAFEAIYPLRGTGDTTMEHVWVAVKPGPDSSLALYRTTRFKPTEVPIVKWHHLRTASSTHHQWDPTSLREVAPTVWPQSHITKPNAGLDLTEAGWQEAEAKARDLGELDNSETRALGELLIQVAEMDLPPAAQMPPFLMDHHARSFSGHGVAGQVLTRNLKECVTAFDLRGWVWQCVWAIGNRASLQRS